MERWGEESSLRKAGREVEVGVMRSASEERADQVLWALRKRWISEWCIP